MPMSSADLPDADKPEPKSKAKAKSGLDEAAKSSDPLVQKLLWDRGARGDDPHVANIDAELRKLGFDI